MTTAAHTQKNPPTLRQKVEQVESHKRDFLGTETCSCEKDKASEESGGWSLTDLAREVKTAPFYLWQERMRWCWASPIKIPNKRAWWMTPPPHVTRGGEGCALGFERSIISAHKLNVLSLKTDVAAILYIHFLHGRADHCHEISATQMLLRPPHAEPQNHSHMDTYNLKEQPAREDSARKWPVALLLFLGLWLTESDKWMFVMVLLTKIRPFPEFICHIIWAQHVRIVGWNPSLHVIWSPLLNFEDFNHSITTEGGLHLCQPTWRERRSYSIHRCDARLAVPSPCNAPGTALLKRSRAM